MEDKFVTAEPIEGTILLNIGLLLETWSNGRLRATRHRIVSPVEEARMSMVLFAVWDEGALVQPSEELRGNDQVRYEGVQSQEYTKAMYTQHVQ